MSSLNKLTEVQYLILINKEESIGIGEFMFCTSKFSNEISYHCMTVKSYTYNMYGNKKNEYTNACDLKTR
jgi:hypothetical protein